MTGASIFIPAAPQFDFMPHRAQPWLADARSLQLGRSRQNLALCLPNRLRRCAAARNKRGGPTACKVDLPDCQRIIPQWRAEISAAVRRMLNMHWDLRPFYAAMRELMRVTSGWSANAKAESCSSRPTLWEDLAKVLLTTNTGWAQTVSMSDRLCRLGANHPTVEGCHAFPSPQRIASMDLDNLKASQ